MEPQSTTTNGFFARLRAVVEGRRDELLARARLARDQHREIGGADLREFVEDGAHARARADERAERRVHRDGHALRSRRAGTRPRSRRGGAWWLRRGHLAHPHAADERAVATAEISRTRTPCSVAMNSAWTLLTLGVGEARPWHAAFRPMITGSAPMSCQCLSTPQAAAAHLHPILRKYRRVELHLAPPAHERLPGRVDRAVCARLGGPRVFELCHGGR
jgi:hypothetical protein